MIRVRSWLELKLGLVFLGGLSLGGFLPVGIR